jgi:enediyne biosynthesis protein E4
VDVIVNDLDGPPMLLRNEYLETSGPQAGHWLKLQLTGTKSNRNAVGARVEVKAGGLTQLDEVRAGDSYLSHSDWRLHFGLGKAGVVDEIVVRWPSGKIEKLTKVAANRVVKIVEK